MSYTINSNGLNNGNPKRKIALQVPRFLLLRPLLLVGLFIMIVKCEICGKEFNRKPFFVKCSRHHYCSLKCAGKGKSKNLLKGKIQKCLICGKEMWVIPSEKKRGRKFCSLKCLGIANRGKNHPRWTGKIKKYCLLCGKTFYVYPCFVKKNRGKFCSSSCSAIYQRKHHYQHNTSIELKVKDWLDNLGIPYQQQVLAEGICRPDFLLSNKLIIECDGDYWHSKKKVKTRDAKKELLLGFKGYTILRLTETDINKHPRKCINKLKPIQKAFLEQVARNNVVALVVCSVEELIKELEFMQIDIKEV